MIIPSFVKTFSKPNVYQMKKEFAILKAIYKSPKVSQRIMWKRGDDW